MGGKFMRLTLTVLLVIVFAACGQQPDTGQSEAAAPATTAPSPVDEPDVSIYEAAVVNEKRSAADRARDADRKPTQMLEFIGITRGMTVLDMFSGGGYYSEILASVVGNDGKVFAHSNEAYLQYVGDEFSNRYANDRLPNVEILMAENNELSLDPESLDAVMLVLSFHDLFYAAPEQGWPLIDVTPFLAELYKGLKPGGLVGVVDHHAKAGSPSETGSTLHRIDPAIVIERMQAAGFELLAQSDVLRNPQDDLIVSVFDASIRGKTDRFVLRFCKPE